MPDAPHVAALKTQEEQRRLSKEQVLEPKIKFQERYIDALGGTVKLRSLSHAQRQSIRQRAKFGSPDYDDDLFTMLCLVESIVDPDLQEEDIEKLRAQDVAIVDELVLQVQFLNMLGKAEELKKD